MLITNFNIYTFINTTFFFIRDMVITQFVFLICCITKSYKIWRELMSEYHLIPCPPCDIHNELMFCEFSFSVTHTYVCNLFKFELIWNIEYRSFFSQKMNNPFYIIFSSRVIKEYNTRNILNIKRKINSTVSIE